MLEDETNPLSPIRKGNAKSIPNNNNNNNSSALVINLQSSTEKFSFQEENNFNFQSIKKQNSTGSVKGNYTPNSTNNNFSSFTAAVGSGTNNPQSTNNNQLSIAEYRTDF